MRTLREFELEQRVRDLEYQIAVARNTPLVLNKYDDIEAVAEFRHSDKELPLVARVSFTQSDAKHGYQVRLSAKGDGTIELGYYLAEEVLHDNGHLEQALITMHENLIQKIIKDRRAKDEIIDAEPNRVDPDNVEPDR